MPYANKKTQKKFMARQYTKKYATDDKFKEAEAQRKADRVIVVYEEQRIHRSPFLLHKSHNANAKPSHTCTIMTCVHAASVRYLPPLGTSPAARAQRAINVGSSLSARIAN